MESPQAFPMLIAPRHNGDTLTAALGASGLYRPRGVGGSACGAKRDMLSVCASRDLQRWFSEDICAGRGMSFHIFSQVAGSCDDMQLIYIEICIQLRNALLINSGRAKYR